MDFQKQFRKEDKEFLLNALKGAGIGLLVGFALARRRYQQQAKFNEQLSAKKFYFSPKYQHDEYYGEAPSFKRLLKQALPAAIPIVLQLLEKRGYHHR